jgi:hypothetical protein
MKFYILSYTNKKGAIMKAKQIRQGDLLFVRTRRKKSSNLKVKDNNIIALGEVSGHGHVLKNGLLLEDENGDMYVDAQMDAIVEHVYTTTGMPAEHKPVLLEKGFYKVIQKRQYDPFEKAIQRVLD